MPASLNTPSQAQLERELQRERQQRAQNDDARTGQSALQEGRVKDARETADSTTLKRQRN